MELAVGYLVILITILRLLQIDDSDNCACYVVDDLQYSNKRSDAPLEHASCAGGALASPADSSVAVAVGAVPAPALPTAVVAVTIG